MSNYITVDVFMQQKQREKEEPTDRQLRWSYPAVTEER